MEEECSNNSASGGAPSTEAEQASGPIKDVSTETPVSDSGGQEPTSDIAQSGINPLMIHVLQ